MLKDLLKNTELSQLLDLVSPAFWQVVPPGEVWRAGRQLVANYRAGAEFQQVRSRLAAIAGPQGVALVEQLSDRRVALSTISPEQRRSCGSSILGLYFAQLFDAEMAVLDLRPERFAAVASADQWDLQWSPRPYYFRWPPEFLDGLRGLYRGFYRQDWKLFDQALEQLNLSPAREAFLRQFGEDQHAVQFRTSHLVDSLHESFVACRIARRKLSGAFLALGFYLTTLYTALESLDVALDVRAIFDGLAAT